MKETAFPHSPPAHAKSRYPAVWTWIYADLDFLSTKEMIEQVTSKLKAKCQELYASPVHLVRWRLQRIKGAAHVTDLLCTYGSSIPCITTQQQVFMINQILDEPMALPVGRLLKKVKVLRRPTVPRNLAYNITAVKRGSNSLFEIILSSIWIIAYLLGDHSIDLAAASS